MTLQFKEPPTFYKEDIFYWKVSDTEMIQFTENFFLEWVPGSEVYGWKKRELSKKPPIGDKEGERVWNLLKKKIESYSLEKETV